MRALFTFLFISLNMHIPAFAESTYGNFEDAQQYGSFYDFVYQSNVVESYLLECTGDRSVAYKFAFATAPISNSYKREILGLNGIAKDPFTNKPLSRRLWDEVKLAVTRKPDPQKNLSEPVLMAQMEVLRQFNDHQEQKDTLCDFVFWDEVTHLAEAIDTLMRDVRNRQSGSSALIEFEKEAKVGLEVIDRLFKANPNRIPLRRIDMKTNAQSGPLDTTLQNEQPESLPVVMPPYLKKTY
ncbi:hypothetical protein [Sideroxydans sp.]